MKSASQSDTVTPYEKQAELRRVLESRYFSKAPKRRLFLEFASGHALQGEGDKLNEYLIGVEVYQRGTDFDAQQDPIVRVQAHEIRRALRNYYETEGRNSPLRIDLPSGQYAPIFTRVKPEATESAAPTQGEPATAPVGERRGFRWQTVLLIGLALGCVALAMMLVRERAQLRQADAPVNTLPESADWFWRPFLAPAASPLVVVPTQPVLRLGTGVDSPETLQEGFAVPKAKMPVFRDTFHFSELKSFVFVPTATDYTGIGEAVGLVNLASLFASQGVTIRVKTSRLTDYTEVQSGNTIMLGGATHWTNRVFDNPRGFSLSEGAFKNNADSSGSQSVYRPKFDAITNRLIQDYALVVMSPNGNKTGRLLLMYGLNTQGTEAAAEYVTNGERLMTLRETLRAASPDKKSIPPFFEAVLAVPVENYVPGGASLVAVRVIPE
jgi:hypothetical protein